MYSLTDINRKLALRYSKLLFDARKLGIKELPRLYWMCKVILDESKYLTEDKQSRWIGFIQASMITKSLLDTDEERDFSRPLFHQYYEENGIEKPETFSFSRKEIKDYFVEY